ncbi:MAG: response regulator transcription factor [Gemmataceae bacterium]|nr:response regulator transcription factor [Gemmataceae bacterium]
MKILIAEDERMSRVLLESVLTEWGYQPVGTSDGVEAWQVLQAEDAPKMAVLDWGRPGLDGLEVCRRVREKQAPEPTYLILLTGRDAQADVVAGLQAGANDYVTKPFDPEELRARLQVGRQVVELQHSLAARVRELEEALAQVQRLQGMLPICSYCKKVRDDHNYWQQVETYFLDHSEVRFSHSICPDCLEGQLKAFSG